MTRHAALLGLIMTAGTLLVDDPAQATSTDWEVKTSLIAFQGSSQGGNPEDLRVRVKSINTVRVLSHSSGDVDWLRLKRASLEFDGQEIVFGCQSGFFRTDDDPPLKQTCVLATILDCEDGMWKSTADGELFDTIFSPSEFRTDTSDPVTIMCCT